MAFQKIVINPERDKLKPEKNYSDIMKKWGELQRYL